VALFNQAYSVVTDNAVDEFLALFSHKTLNYIRAPDENTFCPPLNLIEICFLIPLEPFLKKTTYQKLNQIVMKVVYSPALLIIAFYESKSPLVM
jgi:cation-transporting ATPase 13A1